MYRKEVVKAYSSEQSNQKSNSQKSSRNVVSHPLLNYTCNNCSKTWHAIEKNWPKFILAEHMASSQKTTWWMGKCYTASLQQVISLTSLFIFLVFVFIVANRILIYLTHFQIMLRFGGTSEYHFLLILLPHFPLKTPITESLSIAPLSFWSCYSSQYKEYSSFLWSFHLFEAWRYIWLLIFLILFLLFFQLKTQRSQSKSIVSLPFFCAILFIVKGKHMQLSVAF